MGDRGLQNTDAFRKMPKNSITLAKKKKIQKQKNHDR